MTTAGSFDDLQLRSESDNQRIAAENAKLIRLQAAAQRDHQLHIQSNTCLGDFAKEIQ